MNFSRTPSASSSGKGEIVSIHAGDNLESQNKLKILANLSNLTITQLEEVENKAKGTYPNYKEAI